MKTVKLIYFKDSGKYYCEGEFTSGRLDFEIYEEVRRMNSYGPMPGLVSNWYGYILVLPYEGVPALVDVRNVERINENN